MTKKIWAGLSSLFVFLLCFSLVASQAAFAYESTINSLLGISTSKVVTAQQGDTTRAIRYPSSYGDLTGENLKALLADTYQQSIAEAEEGIVLLKNSGAALPLSSTETRITLFGHAVVQPLYRNSSAGSTAYNSPEGVDLYNALSQVGFSINPTVYDAYQKSSTRRGSGGFEFTTGEKIPWSFGEEELSFYTADLQATWENDYNDAAVVMFAREGGEGNELYINDPAEGISQLALHQQEKDLLAMIRDSKKFKKIIVLLNSGNAMEVGWLDEYSVDACLWVGCPGMKGFVGLANILTGTANPSGLLTSTYAVNSTSAPSVVNSSYNNQTWLNLDEVLKQSTELEEEASYYTVQAEGIYIGYKYYETRYEDTVLGRHKASGNAGSTTGAAWNYQNEVSYPFGYGLSYTSFTQTLDKVEVTEDTITATVTVTNTGSTKGKSVVQVYAQTPYGSYEQQNLVEKAAIQLLDFGKTALLAPGQSETLTLVCDKYLLASYDYRNAKGYIVSEGSYYLAIGENAHDALNNVLAAKGASGMVEIDGTTAQGDSSKTFQWNEKFDDEKYRKSPQTGIIVTNQFEDCDINYWVNDAVTYLTRSDWQGSYPVKPTQVLCSDEMIHLLNSEYYEKPADAPPVASIPQGEKLNIPLAAMHGVTYEDELWKTFLNQLTVSKMASLLPDSLGTAAITNIGKPVTYVGDGPDGITTFLSGYNAKKYGFEAQPTCYTGETTLAATFNKNLMASRGSLMAEEALFLGLMAVWSPGGNLHRTPFGGRNFEYYSEDANMNYLCEIEEVAAMQAKGIVSGIKHCALNDQENNRIGVACFFNEQSLREGGLRGFEGGIAVAKAKAVMQGFNRLGLVGCSLSTALNDGVLRSEWGLEGMIITDACSGVTEGYRAHYVSSLAAGTDNFCLDFNNSSTSAIVNHIEKQDDGYLLLELRRAAKNILYITVNSAAMNGYDSSTTIVSVTPWWIPALYIVIGGSGVLSLFSIVMLMLAKSKEKKNIASKVEVPKNER